MAENKTKPTQASVEQHLAAIDDEGRRKDCEVLARMMAKATKQKAKMWGSAIVGFGSLNYKSASGREGQTCVIGFSSRKGDISVYGTADAPRRDELLARLGKHKVGKGCLYIRKLSDVDTRALEELLAEAVKSRAA
jgi:hypothetical protein